MQSGAMTEGSRIRDPWSGETGTVIVANDCRGRVRWDTPIVREAKLGGREIRFERANECNLPPTYELEKL